jgi:hypothetical protein
MIYGAHAILYSKDAEADRAFFRDVLRYRYADAGHGWQIFALPPAEIAVHPSDKNDVHEVYLMCDDVHALIADMQRHGIATAPIHEERWGLLTHVQLPSGSQLGIYQPLHPSPLDGPAKRPARKAAPRKKAAKPRETKAKNAKKSHTQGRKAKKRAR